MDTASRTVVTFESSAFNVSEPKPYFINPCCFGDDLAKWLSEELRRMGYESTEPFQEDFGWFFNFVESSIKHCFVIGYRPEEKGEGVWIGWLERARLLGRTRGIQSAAIWAVHEILVSSSQIRNIRWHLRRDFDLGDEDAGRSDPSMI